MADFAGRNIWEILSEVKPKPNGQSDRGLVSGATKIPKTSSPAIALSEGITKRDIKVNVTAPQHHEQWHQVLAPFAAVKSDNNSAVHQSSRPQQSNGSRKRSPDCSAFKRLGELKKRLKLEPSSVSDSKKRETNGHVTTTTTKIPTTTTTTTMMVKNLPRLSDVYQPLDLSKMLGAGDTGRSLFEIPLDLSTKPATPKPMSHSFSIERLIDQSSPSTGASSPVIFGPTFDASYFTCGMPPLRPTTPQISFSGNLGRQVSPFPNLFSGLMSSPISRKISPVRPHISGRPVVTDSNGVVRTCVVTAARRDVPVAASTPHADKIIAEPCCSVSSSTISPPFRIEVDEIEHCKKSANISTTEVDNIPILNVPSYKCHSKHVDVRPSVSSPSLTKVTSEVSLTERGLPLAQVSPSRVVLCTAVDVSRIPDGKSTHNVVLPPRVCVSSTEILCSTETSMSEKPNAVAPEIPSEKPPQITPKNQQKIAPEIPMQSKSDSSMMSPPNLKTVGISLSVPGSVSASSSLLISRSSSTLADIISPSMPVLSPHVPAVCPQKSKLPSEHLITSLVFDGNAPSPDTPDGSFTPVLVKRTVGSKTLDTNPVKSPRNPAFELQNCDYNRRLLAELKRPCYAVTAFDRAVLETGRTHQDFIKSTPFYRCAVRRGLSTVSGAGKSPKQDRKNPTSTSSSVHVTFLRKPRCASSANVTAPSRGFKRNLTTDVEDAAKNARTSSSCDTLPVEVKTSRKKKHSLPETSAEKAADVKSELTPNTKSDSENVCSTDQNTNQDLKSKDPIPRSGSGGESGEKKGVGKMVSADSSGLGDNKTGRNVKRNGEETSSVTLRPLKSFCSISSGISKASTASGDDEKLIKDQTVTRRDTDDNSSGSSVVKITIKLEKKEDKSPGPPGPRKAKKSLEGVGASRKQHDDVPGFRISASSSEPQLKAKTKLAAVLPTPSDTRQSAAEATSSSRIGKSTWKKEPEWTNSPEKKKQANTSENEPAKKSTDDMENLAEEPCDDNRSIKSEPEEKKRKKCRRSLLEQIANSDGYIADKMVKPSRSEDLFVDSSLLTREERALQMALMRITKMELRASLKGMRQKRRNVSNSQTANDRRRKSSAFASAKGQKSFASNGCRAFGRWKKSAEKLSTVAENKRSPENSRKARNLWTRERIKSHTLKCRERFYIQQNLDREVNKKLRKAGKKSSGAVVVENGKTKGAILPLSVDTSSVLSTCRQKFSPSSATEHSAAGSPGSTPHFSGLVIPPEVRKLMIYQATGETVLHKAARLGYEEVVQWCCQSRFIDVNVRDNAGYTPLHGSCISGHVNIVRCLLMYGADVNSASRLDGARPLHDAVESDDIEMVRLLLAAGADINLSTYSGKTVDSLACSHDMRQFLNAYLYDLNGNLQKHEFQVDWEFEPTWNASEKSILVDPPTDPDGPDSEQLSFECSEKPFLPIYFLQLDGHRQSDNYILLQDMLRRMRMTRERFVEEYGSEIVVHKVSRAAAAIMMPGISQDSFGDSSGGNSATTAHVELVRLSDAVRSVLDISTNSLSSC